MVRIPKRVRPAGLPDAALRKVKRSKSRSTSQRPVTTQVSLLPPHDLVSSRSSASTPSPSAPTPEVNDLLSGSASTSRLQGTPSQPLTPAPDSTPSTSQIRGQDVPRQCSILNDVQRRQSLLAKLSLNEQTAAHSTPSTSVPTGNLNAAPAPPSALPTDVDVAASSSALTASHTPSQENASVSPTQIPSPETSLAPPLSAEGSASLSGPPVTKTSKLRVSKTSMTARNLAASAFARTHPHATTQEFATHLDNLPAEEFIINETRHRFALAYTAKNPGAFVEEVEHAFESADPDDVKAYREAVVMHAGKTKRTRMSKGKEKAL
ncbi:hypothetical protein NUW54_g13618 [Trametes sanguinea]|uniref:Uncharacterized protein n=1 Tax=Trametes sanguinea TaxID=158606 RepID=A0ACC1MK70_9APHY|nr:hypothetical protein NUW54_g13618 [Trametes sanguinea]